MEGGSTLPFGNSCTYKIGFPSVLKQSEMVNLYAGRELNSCHRTGLKGIPLEDKMRRGGLSDWKLFAGFIGAARAVGPKGKSP